MSILGLAERVDDARRLAAAHTGQKWRADGFRVLGPMEQEEGVAEVELFQAITQAHARYIVAIHNVFLPLTNAWLMASKKFRRAQ